MKEIIIEMIKEQVLKNKIKPLVGVDLIRYVNESDESKLDIIIGEGKATVLSYAGRIEKIQNKMEELQKLFDSGKIKAGEFKKRIDAVKNLHKRTLDNFLAKSRRAKQEAKAA